jgi:protein-disulfide isomerase
MGYDERIVHLMWPGEKMSRFRGCVTTLLAVAALVGSACGGKPTPEPPRSSSTLPEDGEQEHSGQSLAPAPVAPSTPTPTLAVKNQAADMKALERQPGVTPALAQVQIAPGPAHAEIAGKPGVSPAAGPHTAKVKVVVFSDFQCPVCRRAVEPIKALVREFPNDLQVIFKQNALEMHANALGAAAAATAAARQGKFWEYHDLLFQNQRALGEESLGVYAERLGLDLERFHRDRRSEAVLDQMLYERSVAERLDARGTPAFFVNGQKLVGWGSHRGFRGMIVRAVGKVKESSEVPAERRALEATMASGEEGARLVQYLWGTP